MNRHGDRRRPDRRERSSSSEDSPPTRHDKPSRTGLQEYWINGQGINRDVLQRQICFMLGNEAKCKPGQYKGVHGYRVTAVRPFTDKQLEDLVEISEEYEKEIEQHRKKYKRNDATLPYDKSRTSQRHDHPPPEPSRGGYRDERYLQQAYSTPNSSEGYPSHQSLYNQPPTSGYPLTGRRSPGPPPGSSVYPVQGYPGSRSAYQDSSMRPPDVPNMYNAYPYPDEMEIDSGILPPSHRTGSGYPPPTRQPIGYGRDDRPSRGDQYMGHPAFGAPPQGQFSMDPSVPRHVPQTDPVGRAAMGMPLHYDDFGGSPMPSGYKVNAEKRPRPEDYGRRR